MGALETWHGPVFFLNIIHFAHIQMVTFGTCLIVASYIIGIDVSNITNNFSILCGEHELNRNFQSN